MARLAPLIAVAVLGLCLAHGASSLTLSVNLTHGRHNFSSLIFGAQECTKNDLDVVKYKLNRLGGNSFTRYDYENDLNNLASDYYYISNTPYLPNFANTSRGTTYDNYIMISREHGTIPIVQINMIGWIPRNTTKTWSFGVAKYGAQTATECSSSSSYCAADAGSGTLSNGTVITWNDAHDSCKEVNESYTAKRIKYYINKYGSAANGGIKYYELDNEPALWSTTHRDVRKTPLTYDELWNLTVKHASTIKALDSSAMTMGPVAWGWCEYFWQAADACGVSPTDRQAHNNTPFLQWYLTQNYNYYKTTGVKLVDVLSIHWYPQGSEWSNTATVTTRYPSLKSLYNTSYIDQSWIAKSVYLIPRMQQLIASYCPFMKLAITEYNWGGTSITSNFIEGAIAQAEILGILARENVDMATRFPAPNNGTLISNAFSLYTSYDGKNGVSGDVINCTSENYDLVGVYCFYDESKSLLFVVMTNKQNSSTASVTIKLEFFSRNISSIKTWGFSSTYSLQSLGAVTPSGASFTTTLPASSATIAVCNLTATSSSTTTPTVSSSSSEPAATQVSSAVSSQATASSTATSSTGGAATSSTGSAATQSSSEDDDDDDDSKSVSSSDHTVPLMFVIAAAIALFA